MIQSVPPYTTTSAYSVHTSGALVFLKRTVRWTTAQAALPGSLWETQR